MIHIASRTDNIVRTTNMKAVIMSYRKLIAYLGKYVCPYNEFVESKADVEPRSEVS